MGNKFDINVYDERYYNWHKEATANYIKSNMDWYVSKYSPKSIIDYGCGVGYYLLSAYNNGVLDLKGFDIGGENVKKFTPKCIQQYIEYCDITKHIETKKYKLVISIETAEHLEPMGTFAYLSNLVNSMYDDGTLLFSAAPPNQSGTGHINLHEKDWWIEQIQKFGLFYDKSKTDFVSSMWATQKAPYYITNNLLIFTKENHGKV